MRTKIILIIICFLLLANTVNATQLDPSVIYINLVGGDTKNITINVTGVETIYLEHSILPDGIGINVTYPLSIDLLETQAFNMTVKVAFNIAPNNYTIELRYYYYSIEAPDPEDTNGVSPTKVPNLPPFVDPDDGIVYPIIYPNPRRPYHPYFPSAGEPSNPWLYFPLLLIAILTISLTVLYLIKRKNGNKKG